MNADDACAQGWLDVDAHQGEPTAAAVVVAALLVAAFGAAPACARRARAFLGSGGR